MSGSEFDEHLDFDACIEGQCIRADGGSCMPTRFSEEPLKEVAGPVGHFGLVTETFHARDEHAEPHDAHDLVERSAARPAHDRESIEHTLLRARLGNFKRHRVADPACGDEGAIAEWQLPADKEEIPGPHARDVRRNGLWSRRNRKSEQSERFRDTLIMRIGHVPTIPPRIVQINPETMI